MNGFRFGIDRDFVEDLRLSFDEASVNKEIVVVRAEYGFFETKIKILNIKGHNCKHGPTYLRGGFGNIYRGLFMNKGMALKCLPVRSKSTRHHAIKEWLLLKIASIAEIGPQMEPLFGFDLLMYEDCVEFGMESC